MKKYVLSRKVERHGRRRQWRQTFAAILRAAMIEPHQIEITHQTIAIEKLPVEFQGLRVVQLSDVHHSPFLDEERINEAVRMANDLAPDLVVLTGDYISHSRDYIFPCARALGRLRAPHGVFAVLGNHDHWTDGAMMRAALADQGIHVLCNESERIERGSSYIRLAGVDDMMVKRDDLRRALEETYWDETRILLSHNPAIIREAARAGVDLVLSGHTHGGQINWRLLTGRQDRKTARWLRRPSRRLMRGHAQLGSTQLYVNRGLGTVVVPLRYGCTPEVTLLEIVRQ
ncbi:MAG TPA: metallophosphoesterase [Blastocatellia bacterium]